MEAHTQMLSTLHKRIEDAQHLPLQISGGENSTSSKLPQIMEGVHAQIVAANMAISNVENDPQCSSNRSDAQHGRLGQQPRAPETTE